MKILNSTLSLIICLVIVSEIDAQVKWHRVDSLFGPLPSSVHIYKTVDSLEGKPNIAYYLEADMKDKDLEFTTDTTLGRRLKPSEFYEKNGRPILVVNTTFFSFGTNQNLNVVIKDGKLVGYNLHSVPRRGKDTFTYNHPFTSAIGINRKRQGDVAWLFTDSAVQYAYASQQSPKAITDSSKSFTLKEAESGKYLLTIPGEATRKQVAFKRSFRKLKVETAVGGGPALLQQGNIMITNNEELKFGGKAIHDRHPRTAMGYTKDQKLVIMVVEGRNPGKAEGASLIHLAQLLKDAGCWEALNLDGGGSSCMLVNGRETIQVSDKSGQRPVPAVFIIK